MLRRCIWLEIFRCTFIWKILKREARSAPVGVLAPAHCKYNLESQYRVHAPTKLAHPGRIQIITILLICKNNHGMCLLVMQFVTVQFRSCSTFPLLRRAWLYLKVIAHPSILYVLLHPSILNVCLNQDTDVIIRQLMHLSCRFSPEFSEWLQGDPRCDMLSHELHLGKSACCVQLNVTYDRANICHQSHCDG